MIDQTKVIKALKNCTDKPKCRDCPWQTCEVDHEYVELPMDLAKQALAMLEAQEPQVMTLDEVIAAKPGIVVWLEDDDKPDVIVGLMKKVFIYTKVVDFIIIQEEREKKVTADLEEYGIRWRCWTSRPTDGQREATTWQ